MLIKNHTLQYIFRWSPQLSVWIGSGQAPSFRASVTGPAGAGEAASSPDRNPEDPSQDTQAQGPGHRKSLPPREAVQRAEPSTQPGTKVPERRHWPVHPTFQWLVAIKTTQVCSAQGQRAECQVHAGEGRGGPGPSESSNPGAPPYPALRLRFLRPLQLTAWPARPG